MMTNLQRMLGDDNPPGNVRTNKPMRSPVMTTRWVIAGSSVVILILIGFWTFAFCLYHFPHEMSTRRGQARLALLLDEIYHVPLDPSCQVLAAYAGRSDFPSSDFQSEGSDWYLARLDPTDAARFESRLVEKNRGFRMLLEASHVVEILNARRDLQPIDWADGRSFHARARAWWLDPNRDAFAVFLDD